MPQDWNNIDLDSHEVGCAIVDEYTFESLLLEIECNLPVINEDTVREQFYKSLKSNFDEAKDIFESNIKNIVSHAKSRYPTR